MPISYFLHIYTHPTLGTSPTHLYSPFSRSLKCFFKHLSKQMLTQQNT